MDTKLQIALSGPIGNVGAAIISAAEYRAETMPIRIVSGLITGDEAVPGALVEGIEQPLVSDWYDFPSEVNVIIDCSSEAGALLSLEAAFQNKVPLIESTADLPSRLDMFFQKVASVVPVVRTHFEVGTPAEQIGEALLRIAAWAVERRDQPGMYSMNEALMDASAAHG